MVVRRTSLGSKVAGPLYFAQTRDDAAVELAVLDPQPGQRFVAISSSGCVPLSLLASGAERVVSIDLNETQNHLVELKYSALAGLSRDDALDFLGYRAASPSTRQRHFDLLRDDLSPAARAHWERHSSQISRGVVRSGVTERFLAGLAWLVRRCIQGSRRVERLLACGNLEEQRSFYQTEWNRWPWRAFFFAAANRFTFRRVYHPAFFQHVANPSFARHFLGVWERTLTELPVADNPYLHQLLTGYFPVDRPQALFPYLTHAGVEQIRQAGDRLELVDGSLIEYLRGCQAESIHGFSLSNICEWLDAEQIDSLFEQVVRTAAPGARLCFRNFLGWTEVPPRFRQVIEEDVARGEELVRRDRSFVQRRVASCRLAPA